MGESLVDLFEDEVWRVRWKQKNLMAVGGSENSRKCLQTLETLRWNAGTYRCCSVCQRSLPSNEAGGCRKQGVHPSKWNDIIAEASNQNSVAAQIQSRSRSCSEVEMTKGKTWINFFKKSGDCGMSGHRSSVYSAERFQSRLSSGCFRCHLWWPWNGCRSED